MTQRYEKSLEYQSHLGTFPYQSSDNLLKEKTIMTFRDKTVLVTGGTGSFGKHVTELFLRSDAKEIRIFSRDEKKQSEMEDQYPDHRIRYFLGDIKDESTISACIQDVNFVFHAAALKQVPKCEQFPLEAVKTNVIGTENLLRQAEKASVTKVICLSTDKACHPINAMGISKAMMEKIALSRPMKNSQKAPTAINVVRYGNIMCSRGSVIPIFIKQAKSGANLKITLPSMTRFLMSLDDATDLILKALIDGQNGDTFVKKAEACTVGDLAKAICEIFPSKSKVDYVGIRKGEKEHETLVTLDERNRSTETKDFFRFNNKNENHNNRDISDVANNEEFSSENADRLTVHQIIERLLSVDYVQRELNV